MKKLFSAILAMALGYSALLYSTSANAEVQLADGTVLSDSPMWIVTYIEVAPNAIQAAERVLIDQVQASRQEVGSLYVQVVQRISRQYHFVLMEAWASPGARAEHAAANHTLAFREALQPLLYSPYDERVHVGLETMHADAIPLGDSETVFAITHADFSPPEQFAPCNRRPDPTGPCGNDLLTGLAVDSRLHQGNMRFDVLTQTNRLNHMTVVEMWEDLEAQENHQLHSQKMDFRDAIVGLEEGGGVHPDPQFTMTRLIGALWDERLYRLIE